MQEETYRSHQGLQACLQRAREVFFWPGMSAQLKELIEKCSICQSVKPEQASEPLQPHPVRIGRGSELQQIPLLSRTETTLC